MSPHWKSVPIYVVDFEGGARTGVVEFGVVTLFNGAVAGVRTRLCGAAAHIPAFDSQCHGIRDSDVAGAAPFAGEWDYFAGLRRSGLLCAHHAPTEHYLLRRVWAYPGAMPDHARDGAPPVNDWGPWIDTCRLAAVWHPAARDNSLGALVNWFRLGGELESEARRHCPPGRARYHCALYDALAAALLLRRLCAAPDKADSTLNRLVCDSLGGNRASERQQGELDLDFG